MLSIGSRNLTPFCFGQSEDLAGQIELIVFDAAVADGDALRLVKRVGHRAADQEGVRLLHQRLDDADLVRNLRAAENDDERPGRVRRVLPGDT